MAIATATVYVVASFGLLGVTANFNLTPPTRILASLTAVECGRRAILEANAALDEDFYEQSTRDTQKQVFIADCEVTVERAYAVPEIELDYATLPSPSTNYPQLPASIPSKYDLEKRLYDEAGGILIVGRNGAGKTSTATKIAGLLTKNEPAEVYVLDPHFNEIWSEIGLKSIGHIDRIENAIDSLLQELDARCDRKSKKEALGHPILIITDEIGACQKRFSDPKKISTALERFGAEGRKFNILYIGISHSPNVSDLEISAPYRSNYVIIALVTAAISQSNQIWKDDNPKKIWLKQQAYPCLICACGDWEIANHPTHSNYTTFKKKGNPPQGLMPINQLPWATIDEYGNYLLLNQQNQQNTDQTAIPGKGRNNYSAGNEPQNLPPEVSQINLHKAAPYNPQYPDLSKEQVRILEWVQKQPQPAKINDLLKSITITCNGKRWVKDDYIKALMWIREKEYVKLRQEGQTLWIKLT